MFIGVFGKVDFLVITLIPPTTDLDIVDVMPTPAGAASVMDDISIEFILIAESRELKFLRDEDFVFEFVEGVVFVVESFKVELYKIKMYD